MIKDTSVPLNYSQLFDMCMIIFQKVGFISCTYVFTKPMVFKLNNTLILTIKLIRNTIL